MRQKVVFKKSKESKLNSTGSYIQQWPPPDDPSFTGVRKEEKKDKEDERENYTPKQKFLAWDCLEWRVRERFIGREEGDFDPK